MNRFNGSTPNRATQQTSQVSGKQLASEDGPLSNEEKACRQCDDTVGFTCEDCGVDEQPSVQAKKDKALNAALLGLEAMGLGHHPIATQVRSALAMALPQQPALMAIGFEFRYTPVGDVKGKHWTSWKACTEDYANVLAGEPVKHGVLREVRRVFAAPFAGTQPETQQTFELDTIIEQHRLKMTAISNAALGYWKDGDCIPPELNSGPLRHVVSLYTRYADLQREADVSPISSGA